MPICKSVQKVDVIDTAGPFFAGTPVHLERIQQYGVVSHLLSVLRLWTSLILANGLCWIESTTVGYTFCNTSRSETSIVHFFRASYRSYLLLAALSLSTMGLSNYSVGYLNYP